jgi:uncharacterized protein YjiS (DUF1127 family)
MRQIDPQLGFATLFSTLLALWQQRACGRRRLRRFDDHLLRDIGVTRLQAAAEADKPFWRA